MKRTLLALAITLLALAPRPASAQVSIWLQRGVSGFGGALAVAANSDETIGTVSGGYSYQGFLDFDLNLNYYAFNKDSFSGASVAAYGLAPAIQYHPLKQSAEMPVSLGLGVGFQKYFFTSSDLEAEGISLDAIDVSVGVSVYRFFRLGPNIGVIPAMSLAYVHNWTTATFGGRDTTTEANNYGLGIGAYFAYIDDAGRIFGLVPTITFGLGDSTSTTFGLEFGIIISQQ